MNGKVLTQLGLLVAFKNPSITNFTLSSIFITFKKHIKNGQNWEDKLRRMVESGGV